MIRGGNVTFEKNLHTQKIPTFIISSISTYLFMFDSSKLYFYSHAGKESPLIFVHHVGGADRS
jgi:hypothetical protein